MKKDLDNLMREGERQTEHPDYPLDMIDKLWDDYHEAREEMSSPNKVLEYFDGETREAKISLKAVDYRAL